MLAQVEREAAAVARAEFPGVWRRADAKRRPRLAVSDADERIRAAGGVVTRASARRQRSSSSSCTDPATTTGACPRASSSRASRFEDAARREIEEETGLRVELGAPLPPAEYLDRHGRPKVVHYWMMTPVGETRFEPNDEVDETRWITSAEAATLLSYEHDRRLVATVADTSPPGGPS